MIEIIPLSIEHMDQVYEIELESFTTPWRKEDLKLDAINNLLSRHIVAVEGEDVLGYAGMWLILNEAHITNIAVRKAYRQKGIGDMLMKGLEKISREENMMGITLEVRINNYGAQKLYLNNGYVVEGIRKNYYRDTQEDALIMWKYFEKEVD